MIDETILQYILEYTDCGADYKQFCLVSKQWYRVINEIFPKGGKFVNHLMTLINLFPYQNWSVKFLAENPNFRLDKIKSEEVRSHFSYSFTHKPVPEQHMSWEEIQNNPPQGPWYVYRSSVITPEIVDRYPGFMTQQGFESWDYRWLSCNDNFTWDIVKQDLTKNWGMQYIVQKKSTTFEDFKEILAIYNHKEHLCDYNSHEYHVDYENLENCEKIQEFVGKNLNYYWDYANLLKYKVLSWDFIAERYTEIFESLPPNWVVFDRHDFTKMPVYNVTFDIVLNNPHLPWDYDALCAVMPFDVINSFPMFCDYRGMSKNPHLTWDMVLEKPDRWDYVMLSLNTFNMPMLTT